MWVQHSKLASTRLAEEVCHEKAQRLVFLVAS